MDDNERRGDVGHIDTIGVHQPDPFARTRPDADSVGVPGETVSGAAAGPAPDTPVTTIVEDERGRQIEYAKPASVPRAEPADEQTADDLARRGGAVKTGALTPAGTPKPPDLLGSEIKIPRPAVTSED
jgi:hypothetical protein